MAESPQTLALASEHLCYEVTMLRFTARQLAERQAEGDEPKNALLESFAIHVRNLMNFFFRKESSRVKNEMLALDYLDNWNPPKSEYLRRIEGKINEEISHLSYKRNGVSPEAKKWRIDLIVAELEQVLTAFLRRVPDAHLGGHMQQLKGSFSQHLGLGITQSITGSTSNSSSTSEFGRS
jgi:hypothetical protein